MTSEIHSGLPERRPQHSIDGARPIQPKRETIPWVGLKPKTPMPAAATRASPILSIIRAKSARPRETAKAVVSPFMPNPSSLIRVAPTSVAPACNRRSTTVAFSKATKPSRAGVPASVGQP